MATRTLNVLLTGDPTQMKAAFASAIKGSAGAALAVGAVAIAAEKAGEALYNIGSEFDQSYDKIQTLTGKSGKQLDKLKNDFRNVVSSVPTDFEDAADAVGELNSRLDVSGHRNRELSKQFLELSRLTGTDVTENIKTVARSFKDWEVQTSKQNKVLDDFFRASERSGAPVAELADEVVKFGSPLRQMGFQLGEAIAMFASFEKSGVNIQTMLPGLKFALKTFLKEDRNPKNALQNTFKGIEEGTITASKALEIFGQRAGADMIEAVEQGRFHLSKFQSQIENGKDTIRGVGKETMDASENFKLLGNRIKVLLEPLASFIYNGLGKLSGMLAKLSFTKLARELGLTKKDLKDVGRVVGAIGKLFLEVFGKTIKAAVNGAVQVLKGAVQLIKGIINAVSDIIHGRWSKAWNDAKKIVSGAINVVIGAVKAMTSPIRGSAEAVGSALTKTFGGAWGTVKGIFKDGINDVIGFLDTLIHALNSIPGIPDIGEIHKIGEGGGEASTGAPGGRNGGGNLGKHHPGAQPRYSGGPITRPMAIVGEEAPQHHEWVIATNPAYRKNNVAYWMQAGRDLGVPGFSIGGAIGGAVSGAAGFVKGAAEGAFNTAAGAIAHLPTPHLPKWLAGLGSYVINQVTDYITSGFHDNKLGNLTGLPGKTPAGVGSFGGEPVDKWIIPILAWARKHGWGGSVTSGYRSEAEQAALWANRGSNPNPVAPPGTSNHEKASYPGGAVDVTSPEVLAHVLKRYPRRPNLVWGPEGGNDDPVHFSATGHARGGLMFFKKGGLIRGKVSWFNGGTEASGMNTTQPGMALNLNPGTESGWNNSTTQGWISAARAGHPVFGRVTIAGHTANLPITDLGPAGFTGRAIDITEGGVRKLGLSTSSFPTDAIGTVSILTPGSGGGASPRGTGPKAKPEMGLSGAFYGARPGVKASTDRSGIGRAGVASFAGLKNTPLSPTAQALPPNIQRILASPGIKYKGKVEAAELALSQAEGTEGLEDDLAALAFEEELYGQNLGRIKKKEREVEKRLKHKQSPKKRKADEARAARLRQERKEVEEAQASAHQKRGEVGEGAGEEKEVSVREQIEAMKELSEEVRKTREHAETIQGTSAEVAWRALSDAIAGRLGPAINRRATTPGAGAMARL